MSGLITFFFFDIYAPIESTSDKLVPFCTTMFLFSLLFFFLAFFFLAFFFLFFSFFLLEMTKLKGIEKRYIKPLPTIDNSLDNASKKHVINLLTHWLQELNIPMSWLQVLLDTVVFKLFEAFHSHHMTKEEKIHVQFFSTHMPNDSKFLIDVYHGNPLHFGNYGT